VLKKFCTQNLDAKFDTSCSEKLQLTVRIVEESDRTSKTNVEIGAASVTVREEVQGYQ